MSPALLPLLFPSGRLVRALAVSLILLAGCGSAPHRPDILIVVVDTLRADRVGEQRSGRSLTPSLDSFAQGAVVYRNAYATSPWTNPSVASLMTSRFQSQHGIVWFDTVLSASELTLAEVLREHGYATAGFVANPLLRSKHGFDQGFDVLRTLGVKRTGAGKPELYARARSVNEAALSWVDGVKERDEATPFFLYLHYMEPHHPFDPPLLQLEKVRRGWTRSDLSAVNEAVLQQDSIPIDEATLRDVRAAYDAEVMSVDAEIGSFFRSLDERDLLRDAIVVVTADHGEELLEHGYVGHHQALYEESIRVPLIVRAPGLSGPAEVETYVSLLDVAPTILDLADLPRPKTFEGSSLPRRASTGGDARPEVVSELVRVKIIPYKSTHERAVIGDGRKLILGVDGQVEFYDLGRDPLETNPDALDGVDRAELIGRAEQVRALAARGQPAPSTRELDADALQQLEALGYKR